MTDGLDFSGLTDDQLLSLLQELIGECLRRGPATAAAADSATIDAAERVRILTTAIPFEIAKMRAEERARIARQARAEAAEILARERQEAERERQAENLARAARTACAAADRRRDTLTRMADLLGRQPGEIAIYVADTRRGRRVLVNLGADRYAHTHLVDYQIDDGRIFTTRAAVRQKSALAALCAEIVAGYPVGTEIVWEPQQ